MVVIDKDTDIIGLLPLPTGWHVWLAQKSDGQCWKEPCLGFLVTALKLDRERCLTPLFVTVFDNESESTHDFAVEMPNGEVHTAHMSFPSVDRFQEYYKNNLEKL